MEPRQKPPHQTRHKDYLMRFPLLLAAAGTAALAALAPLSANPEVELSAEDVLAPYYAKLERELDLPVAPPAAQLAQDTVLTRIGVGSCNHQSRSQHMWARIAAADPQLFLFIGDNNYGDNGWDGDAALGSLRAAYAKQAETPELAAFRKAVPMMAAWDDHDYGFNDAGASFTPRRWSETLFETFWGSPQEVRERPGIYSSTIVGEEGRRTQVILLDTRFFRSDLEAMPYSHERPPLGPYVPSTDPEKTMLGEAQWQWLAAELEKPADFRIVASSIQVLTDAHNYESWETMPLERAKLYRLLAGREESGLVLLSGDRHAGGIYTDTPAETGGEQLWELTSSSLNLAFNDTASNTAREPDPKRLTDFISEENFGLVDIDWKARTFTLSLRGNQGEERVSRTVKW
jgi:alkaline phosphatase D